MLIGKSINFRHSIILNEDVNEHMISSVVGIYYNVTI